LRDEVQLHVHAWTFQRGPFGAFGIPFGGPFGAFGIPFGIPFGAFGNFPLLVPIVVYLLSFRIFFVDLQFDRTTRACGFTRYKFLVGHFEDFKACQANE
jgi:ABC-type tungstate transport system substrate-binding protein